MFCSNCGTKLEATWVVCPNCGAKVSDTESAQKSAVDLPAWVKTKPMLTMLSLLFVFLLIMTISLASNSSRQVQQTDNSNTGTSSNTDTESGGQQQPQQNCSWQVVPNTNYIPGSNTSGFNNQYKREYVCN
jgi:hypothetical protein